MLAVATAGEPSAVASAGVCVRSEGEPNPMLFAVPRLAPQSLAHPRSLWARLSGEGKDFAMLGLGDLCNHRVTTLRVTTLRATTLCGHLV